MVEIIIRFMIGGLVVSVFAVMGDLLKPKSFAGLFGAAPSVALATLGLTVASDGARYASIGRRRFGDGERRIASLCGNCLATDPGSQPLACHRGSYRHLAHCLGSDLVDAKTRTWDNDLVCEIDSASPAHAMMSKRL